MRFALRIDTIALLVQFLSNFEKSQFLTVSFVGFHHFCLLERAPRCHVGVVDVCFKFHTKFWGHDSRVVAGANIAVGPVLVDCANCIGLLAALRFAPSSW